MKLGIFGTKKTTQPSIDQAAEMIGEYFHHRGLEVGGHAMLECDYGWWITEGSAKIYIFVQEERTGPVVRVNSPILRLPEKNREPLYLRLLEINRDLSQCCAAVFEEVVIINGQRPLLGLDQEELNALIWNVSYVADTLDDQLCSEFGCTPYAEA